VPDKFNDGSDNSLKRDGLAENKKLKPWRWYGTKEQILKMNAEEDSYFVNAKRFFEMPEVRKNR
jgi:hypothetical protein